MQKFGNESGQTLIIVALSMSVLLGFTAFATDVGVLLHQKRLAQTAADSAAIAGAEHLGFGSAAVQSAAQADAAANGFNTQNGATVTVTPSPTTGAFTGSTYVQVTVSQNVQTTFAGILGYGGMGVSASAVAALLPSTGCVYVLSPSGDAAMSLQGSFDVSTPGCGVIVDSNKPDALTFTGGSGTLTAAYVNVVGGDNNGAHATDSATVPTLGVAQISDPLNYLNLPSYQSTLTNNCSTSAPVSGTASSPTQLTPGCWSSSGNITLNNVTFAQSGVYTFNLPATGNLILSGNVGVPLNSTTTGVTLYLTNGGISATTNSTLNLVAPTSQTSGAFYTTTASGNIISSTSPGPFENIAVYIVPQAVIPTPQTQVIDIEMGEATGILSGIIYAPGAELFIHDSGSDSGNGGTTTGTVTLTTDIVTYTFLDQTGELTIKSYGPTQPDSPLNRVTLVL